MAKQEKKIDETTFLFAVRVVFSLGLVLIVALGADVYHAVHVIGKLYGSSV